MTSNLRCVKVGASFQRVGEIEARKACLDDWPFIEVLNRGASRTLPQLWHWEEHLTADAPFVIVEYEGVLAGALFAWSDESPVAWVRLATLDDGIRVNEWLDLALPPVLKQLRRLEIQILAWMDYGGWAEPHLRERRFERLTEVITLAKYDGVLPDLETAGVCLRPVSVEDIPAVVAVDQAAFDPHWWHGEATMRRRAVASAHFAVAELEGQIVGYAEGQFCLPMAHLNRIAVHPRHRGRGVGALLLQDTLRAFWRRGADRITLNTQVDNRDSQRLYRRFGFEPTGDSTTAWELAL